MNYTTFFQAFCSLTGERKDYVGPVRFRIPKITDETKPVSPRATEFSSLRIQSIEIDNLKGVRHGKIELYPVNNVPCHEDQSSILGIYGQNGSGKTALIEALFILSEVMAGRKLPENVEDYIHVDSDRATIKIVFEHQPEDRDVIEYIAYSFDLVKVPEDHPDDLELPPVVILNETISLTVRTRAGKLIHKTRKLFDSNSSNKVTNGSYYSTLVTYDGKEYKIEDDAVEDKWDALTEGYSAFFGNGTIVHNEFKEIELGEAEPEDNVFHPLDRYDYLEALSDYACNNIYISGASLFRLFTPDENPIYFKNGLLITREDEPSKLSVSEYLDLQKKLESFNTALSAIVPGLSISAHSSVDSETIKQLIANTAELTERKIQRLQNIDKKEYNLDDSDDFFEYMSVRSAINDELNEEYKGRTIDNCITEVMLFTKRGNTEVPLRDESEGIKRIIYILDLFVAAYNSPYVTLVVDEFDAGVFEYLLGELLSVFEESGKGQLIFTAHNLRPLESINKKSVCFTTTNPDNRYIRLKYLGHTNNLRDVYFRQILMEEQDEVLYQDTKRYKLVESLRKAGDQK